MHHTQIKSFKWSQHRAPPARLLTEQGRGSRAQKKGQRSADPSWDDLKGSMSGTDINTQGTHRASLRKAISLPDSVFLFQGWVLFFFFFCRLGKDDKLSYSQ